MSVTVENLQALGNEVRRAREAKGITTLKELQRLTGISQQRLSQIETARVDKDRSPVVPGDDKIDKLAEALDVPISRMHALLGRMPDQPFRVYRNAETAQFAEEYDALPDWARAIVTDCISSVKRAAEVKEA
ncbi:MAG: helix-turn-helix transcriptional regulator [Capsulimonadaceae bacterium]|nr:helix-turn-helix transcriptional regulator [Capsulimonadaceae bacterium]